MRLCVVHINAEKGSQAYTALIDGIFAKAKRDETTIEHRYTRLRRAPDTVFAYPYFLNSVDVVEEIARAGEEGFDGAMVACSGDPGILVARSVTDIPVVGPFEAAIHLAASYGQLVGVVTVEDRAWADTCKTLVATNGLSGRCAGVRRIETPSLEAFTIGFQDPARIAADIESRSRELVDDGANVIILGSAGLSCIASAAGLVEVPGTGVPIFDVLTIGLKTLEMRVDLSERMGLPVTSRTGVTQRLPAEDKARVRALFDN
jgi:allantoin racemase